MQSVVRRFDAILHASRYSTDDWLPALCKAEVLIATQAAVNHHSSISASLVFQYWGP